MRKLIKSIFILLLILLGFGAASLTASKINEPAKDSLIVKQYSIDSGDTEIREELAGQEGRLTFRILAGYTTGLDAEQILKWVGDETIQVDGIRFDVDRATVTHEKKLSVPFQFERPLRNEYLETELRISGSDWIEDAGTPVSLYGGAHGVVNINLIGEGKRLARELVSSHKVDTEKFSFESPDLSSKYGYQPVFAVRHGEQSDKKRSGFFHRNRYWMVGAATLVASSTTALILTAGDSTTYLPEPPGRPAFR